MIPMPRAAQGWSQLALQVAGLLAIVGVVQTAAERTGRRFDLTPTRDFSLSVVTRRVLAEVTGPLRVTVFFRRHDRQPPRAPDDLARLRRHHLAVRDVRRLPRS